MKTAHEYTEEMELFLFLEFICYIYYTPGASGRGFSGTYSSRTALLSGGGGPGGEENPPQSHPLPQDAMNEQVTLILVRLQQDMNSVLNRLNRLETRVTDAQVFDCQIYRMNVQKNLAILCLKNVRLQYYKNCSKHWKI